MVLVELHRALGCGQCHSCGHEREGDNGEGARVHGAPRRTRLGGSGWSAVGRHVKGHLHNGGKEVFSRDDFLRDVTSKLREYNSVDPGGVRTHA